MYLVSVSPITSTTGRNSLSYFSLENLIPGRLVRISLRRKVAKAVVLGVENLKNRKSEIRRADFALKKIAKRDILKESIDLKAMGKVAEYYGTSIGAILSAFKL